MKNYRQQHGFLMVEVLVATVIIAVALVTAAGMFVQSTQAQSKAANYTAAAAIAQHYLERTKAGLLVSPFDPVYTENLNNVEYTITVQETASDIDNRLFNHTVTVFWMDRNQEISLPMTTYILKGNIAQFP